MDVAGNNRKFDVIIIGGGSFGSVVANGLFMRDQTRSRRILLLEQGPFVLPEHVQNLPFMGADPGYRVPWVVRQGSDLNYAGLLYAIGGRSLTWGGWSPELLHDAHNDEMVGWPASVIADLQAKYFHDAGEQIGVNSTNDYVYGPLHSALRQQLLSNGPGGVFAALPLAELLDHAVVRAFERRHGAAPSDDQLRGFLNLPTGGATPRATLLDLLKLEAPLAVQATTETGIFPVNKFSSVPLLVQACRLASGEADGVGQVPDARKRLMVVPRCQVVELVTETQADNWIRVTGVRVVDTSGPDPVERTVDLAPPAPDGRQSAVVLALGTIETTRVALTTFQSSLAGRAAERMGKNLVAHLRSNLNIRVPRAAIAGVPAAGALQVSALFVKSKAQINGLDRYFHLQITASGLGRFGNESEAELFKKIPTLDHVSAMLEADDKTVVVTIRGIGEMVPQNPDSFVDLAKTPSDSEYNRPKAFVDFGDSRQPAGGSPQTQSDRLLWNAMDSFTDEVALVFANGHPFEIIKAAQGKTIPVPAGANAAQLAALHPHSARRDRLGTTHHEAGTMWMDASPANGVTNDFGRVHDTTNCYVAGPALYPTIGSPNPMLTGVALGRRTVDLLTDHVLPRASVFAAAAPWRALFDSTAKTFGTDWGRVSPDVANGFALINGEIVTYTNYEADGRSKDIGLLYYQREAFADFTLRLQFRILDAQSHNTGVFVRFRNPMIDPTPIIAQRIQDDGDAGSFQRNRAWGAVHSGFEVQIDDTAKGDARRDFYGIHPEPDGLRKNRTGAIYKIPAADSIPTGGVDAATQAYQPGPSLVPGRWYEYVIDVRADNYTVDLTDLASGVTTRTTTFQNTDPERGVALVGGQPAGYIGLQSYPNSTVAYRHIEIQP
ncbi:family 16 glycoside hydrolase [Rhizobium mongolense]|uniref:family 16 glycoside hydrolase n=1 Tax=Rhizobium mongolense TaxID=57676 RepID=UPI003555EBFA